MAWSGGSVIGDTHAASLSGSAGTAAVSEVNASANNNTPNAAFTAPANNISNTTTTTEEDLSTPAAVVVPATPNKVYLHTHLVATKTSSNGTVTIRHYRGAVQVGSFTTASITAGDGVDTGLVTVLTDETAGSTTYKSTIVASTASCNRIGGTGVIAVGGSVSGDTHAATLTGSSGTCA